MKYRYDVAVLGIRLSYQARSLSELRGRILVKYLKHIGPDQRHWPLVPTIVLLGTNDPRAELPDPRLVTSEPRAVLQAPTVPDATNPVTSLLDWKNRVPD